MNLNVLEDMPNVRLVTCLTPTYVGKTSMYKNCNFIASAATIELKKQKEIAFKHSG